MVEKYYNENDELGVLYSPGFGAGWSTWDNEELAYDKRIVEYWLNENPTSEQMSEFLESIGYHNVYMGGIIVWKFRGFQEEQCFMFMNMTVMKQ